MIIFNAITRSWLQKGFSEIYCERRSFYRLLQNIHYPFGQDLVSRNRRYTSESMLMISQLQLKQFIGESITCS